MRRPCPRLFASRRLAHPGRPRPHESPSAHGRRTIRFQMKSRLLLIVFTLLLTVPGVFAATLTFGTSAPTATANAISNLTGATYDANNVGGSGANSNGGATTARPTMASPMWRARPAQGQTFTTGTNAGGYTLSSITVRMQGYTNNTASGSNIGDYSLSGTSSTFRVRVGRISGTTFIPYTIEYALSGGTGNPGTGGYRQRPRHLPDLHAQGAVLFFSPTQSMVLTLAPLQIISRCSVSVTRPSGGNPYTAGTAYTSGSSGSGVGTITTQTGDRVFQVNLTAYTPPAAGAFVHPGLLNTETDFERMRTNVALGVEPWLSQLQCAQIELDGKYRLALPCSGDYYPGLLQRQQPAV